jgi:hypothetical protein
MNKAPQRIIVLAIVAAAVGAIVLPLLIIIFRKEIKQWVVRHIWMESGGEADMKEVHSIGEISQ